jgi:hypothetical protein
LLAAASAVENDPAGQATVVYGDTLEIHGRRMMTGNIVSAGQFKKWRPQGDIQGLLELMLSYGHQPRDDTLTGISANRFFGLYGTRRETRARSFQNFKTGALNHSATLPSAPRMKGTRRGLQGSSAPKPP